MSTAHAASPTRFNVNGREVPWSTLPELVKALAREHGDAHATEIDGRSLTYREIDEFSDRVAASFAVLGIAKGDHIVGMMFNCTEAVIAWLAAAKLGAVWIPLNVGLVGQDLAYALTDATPKLFVADRDNAL